MIEPRGSIKIIGGGKTNYQKKIYVLIGKLIVQSLALILIIFSHI